MGGVEAGPDHGPVRLEAQDTALSRRQRGFESRTGRQANSVACGPMLRRRLVQSPSLPKTLPRIRVGSPPFTGCVTRRRGASVSGCGTTPVRVALPPVSRTRSPAGRRDAARQNVGGRDLVAPQRLQKSRFGCRTHRQPAFGDRSSWKASGRRPHCQRLAPRRRRPEPLHEAMNVKLNYATRGCSFCAGRSEGSSPCGADIAPTTLHSVDPCGPGP